MCFVLKLPFLWLFPALAVSFALIADESKGPTPEQSAILVTGNDFELTADEVDQRLMRLAPEVRSQYKGPEGHRHYLRELVRLEIFGREAREIGLDKDAEVQQRIQDVADALLAHQYVQHAVIENVTIPEEEVLERFKIHKERFVTPELIQAPSILLSIPEAGSPEDTVKQQAKVIVEQLRAGADFESLRKEYSDDRTGHDNDFFPRERLVPPVADIVFRLNPGEISEPIRVDGGFRIFMMRAKRPEEIQDFQSVKDEILSELIAEKTKQIFKAEEQRLLEKYNVVISEEKGSSVGENGPNQQASETAREGAGTVPQ